MNTFTADQFQDIARHVVAHGQFTCFPGLDALRDCEEIPDPATTEYRDVLFLKDNCPYAVYECGFGFRVLPSPVAVPLTGSQFNDLADWISDCGTFRGCVELEVLQGCDAHAVPGNEEAGMDSAQIFTRNGVPVALEYGDVGFIVVSAD